MDKRHARLPSAARWFIVIVAVMLPVFLFTASAYEAGPPPPPDDPYETSRRPESAVIRDTIFDKTLDKKLSGFDSSLADVIRQSGLSVQERTEQLTASGYEVTDGRVQVQITVDPQEVDQVIAAIENQGGEITKVSQTQDRLQGWIPLSSLKQVNEIIGVYKIRRPAYAYPADILAAGSSMTEGVSVMNATPWHTAGITGNGVKVGIIDGGFTGFTSLLGTDLPASVTFKNFVDGETDPQVDGTTIHGTACAEIIHDTAPGADLYLAKVNSVLDLQEAMLWLKDTHQVDIISTSLGWFNVTPGDGSGILPDLVNQARSAGILWTTAAGNYREKHYGGTFSDTNGDDFHDFAHDSDSSCLGPSGFCYLLPSGVPITVYLRWDDWTSVTQDLDLTLVRCTADWMSCANYDWSWDYQDGSPGQTPTEAIFSVTSGDDAFYLLAVKNWNTTWYVDFELISIEWSLEFQVYARSIANLADAPGAMTVAALDVVSPYPQESYSSEGPTNGPGGTIGGGFIKPDIAAFANVSTESYGPGPTGFNGTSAATPHVAGAAALIKSAYPSYTPDQIQTYLETNAVDMGPGGMDTLFGYGRLLLPPPPHLLYLPLIMR